MNRQEIEAWLMARSLRRHATAQPVGSPFEVVAEAPDSGPASESLAERPAGASLCEKAGAGDPPPEAAVERDEARPAHDAGEIWDGRPRQSRRKAAGVDVRIARCARWADVMGLLHGRTPDYLVPLLSYALGVKQAPCGPAAGLGALDEQSEA